MTIIIAEAGVNHNGDIDLAKKMIDVAAEAGADYVKFQTFSAASLVTKGAPKAQYQRDNTGSDEDQFDMLKKLELSKTEHEMLIAHCRANNIGFLSTAFDIESLDFLSRLDCLDMVKVPSGELTNLPLLRRAAALRLPIILSTGMADMSEIEAAILALEGAGCGRETITVLHCTTEYPAPYGELNLRAINTISKHFGVSVGYSDHSAGLEVAVAAVARGARVIEKHFTLDKGLPGPDHKASLEPDELAAMISAIRNVECAMGDGVKQPTPSELRNKIVARKSIVAACDIAVGEILSETNLTVKRPGDGLSPMRWDEVVGQRAKKSFKQDEAIEI
ncbi:MAG: N-acetylneuraminate synthase [Parvibaculales bacterium]